MKTQALGAWLVRTQSKRLAQHFLAAESDTALAAVIADLARVPALVTVDAVGEAVLTEAEADAYRDRNLHLLRRLPHLSLKLTALTPRFDPLGTHSRCIDQLVDQRCRIERAVRAGFNERLQQHWAVH